MLRPLKALEFDACIGFVYGYHSDIETCKFHKQTLLDSSAPSCHT